MAASSSPAFRRFPDLPFEIRERIWHDALPDDVGPGLFFYRRGFWTPRRLTEADRDFDPVRHDLNMNLEYRLDLLDDSQLRVPLACVNREARNVVLPWTRAHGIELRPRKCGWQARFLRRWDSARDALYLPLDKLYDFHNEQIDRMFESDIYGMQVSVMLDLPCLAVSEALIRDPDNLRGLFENYSSLSLLLVVVGPEPDPSPAVKAMNVQRFWEADRRQSGSFFWNLDRVAFDYSGGDFIGDEALYAVFEEANKVLAKEVARDLAYYWPLTTFEVRPVAAVGW